MAEPKKKKSNTSNGMKVALYTPNALTLEHKNQSSVELKRNSKGNTEFIIKVYGTDAPSAATEASKVYDDLHKQYPE